MRRRLHLLVHIPISGNNSGVNTKPRSLTEVTESRLPQRTPEKDPFAAGIDLMRFTQQKEALSKSVILSRFWRRTSGTSLHMNAISRLLHEDVSLTSQCSACSPRHYAEVLRQKRLRMTDSLEASSMGRHSGAPRLVAGLLYHRRGHTGKNSSGFSVLSLPPCASVPSVVNHRSAPTAQTQRAVFLPPKTCTKRSFLL